MRAATGVSRGVKRRMWGVFGALAAVLCSGSGAAQETSSAGKARGELPERVYQASPPFFIEHFNTPIQVSPDERLAIIGSRHAFTVVDLQTGRATDRGIWPGLDSVFFARFGPHGDVILLGAKAGATGWFSRGASGPEPIGLPPDAVPTWSPDGRLVAFTRSQSPENGVFIGTVESARPHAMAGAVAGFAWFPDSKAVLVAITDPTTGLTSLVRLDAATGQSIVMARELDTEPFTTPIAVTTDGRGAYIGLASNGHPDDSLRHVPRDSTRYLRIYRVDLATGERRAVARAPSAGDSYAPVVAGSHLYWVRTNNDVAVVVMPIDGGPVRTVEPDAMIPAWRPDGRQIAAVYAQFRQADWGLNLDVGVVDVDAKGHATSAWRPFIAGWGEDFVPAWSPDGRWVAYHSHRSARPTPYYMAPGRTDDIWIRPAGAPAHDPSEVRLTDFGWECGFQTWSRDGKHLVFLSWDKSSNIPGVSHAYVIDMDPATGHAIGHRRLPLPDFMTNTPWAAWSPANGDVGVIQSLGGDKDALWVVPASGAAPRKLVDFGSTTDLGIAGWTPDGTGLVYSATSGSTMQLFWISAQGGAPRQLTHDSGNLFEPAVSPDGSLIAATRLVRHEEIWRVSLRRG